MSEGDSLLAYCVEHPDDDAPRLVYADWLEENGQADRAEFIRVEIEMAPLEDEDGDPPAQAECPRYYELARRRDDLLAAHRREWFGAVDEMAEHVRTKRGFIDYVDVDARTLAVRGKELFAAAPFLRMVYLDKIGKNIPALAALPELARLRELGFLATTLDSAGLAALCRSPYLPPLRRLAMMECRIGPPGVRALVAAPILASLVELDLSENPLYDDGVEALLTARHLSNLESLDLSNVGMTGWVNDSLSEAMHLSRLRHFCLSRNHLDSGTAAAIANGPQFAALRSLLLDGNPLRDEGFRALARSKHPRLESLYLQHTEGSDAGLAALFRSETLATVRYLSLAGNAFGRSAVEALATSAPLSNVRELTLSDCGLDSAAARRLASRRWPSLAYLTLSRNAIGPQGATAIREAMDVGRLKSLTLDRCGLGDEGAAVIAAAERFGALTYLSLDGNGITDVGARALARAPFLSNATWLSMKENDLTDAGKRELTERFGEAVRL